MRNIDKFLFDFKTYFEDKLVLEIACGDSDFSLSVAKYASSVFATDKSLERINKRNIPAIPSNVKFEEMDAKNLAYSDNYFDVTVCYNALGHLEEILPEVICEMIRVTRYNGYIMFCTSWKADKIVLESLLSMTPADGTLHARKQNSFYSSILLKKVQSEFN